VYRREEEEEEEVRCGSVMFPVEICTFMRVRKRERQRGKEVICRLVTGHQWQVLGNRNRDPPTPHTTITTFTVFNLTETLHEDSHTTPEGGGGGRLYTSFT